MGKKAKVAAVRNGKPRGYSLQKEGRRARVAVDLDHFRAAVAPTDAAGWAELGLVAIDGATVQGEVAIRASGPLLIAHDRPIPRGGKRADFVLGVTGATLTLAEVTVRPRSRRTRLRNRHRWALSA